MLITLGAIMILFLNYMRECCLLYYAQHSLAINLIIAAGAVGGVILLVLVILLIVFGFVCYKNKKDVRNYTKPPSSL